MEKNCKKFNGFSVVDIVAILMVCAIIIIVASIFSESGNFGKLYDKVSVLPHETENSNMTTLKSVKEVFITHNPRLPSYNITTSIATEICTFDVSSLYVLRCVIDSTSAPYNTSCIFISFTL